MSIAALRRATRTAHRSLRPPPRWTLSQWADARRYLSPEASASPGRWKTSRTPYLKEVMDAISDPAYSDIVCKFSAQVGKALALDTPIRTPSGWTTMGELVVGDTVFDEAGRPCRVTAATRVMHDRPCYRVVFSDGSSVIADADHRWFVESDTPLNGYNSPRQGVLNTSELIPTLHYGKGRNRYSIPVASALDMKPADLSMDPYLLGVWLGDGHSYSANITCSEGDLEHFRSAFTGQGHQIEVSGSHTLTLHIDRRRRHEQFCVRGHDKAALGTTKQGTCSECSRIHSRNYGRLKRGTSPYSLPARVPTGTWYERLRLAGLLGSKKIPSAFLNASVAQRWALLQGLMDTDGTIDKRGRSSFCTTSPALASAFYDLVTGLGLKTTWKTKDPWCRYKGEISRGQQAFVFSFMAYQDCPVFRLPRKRSKQPSRIGRRTTETERRRIVAIEPVPSVPVRCIQVDSPNHLYLCGKGLIPTHNTEVELNAAGYFIDQDPCPILWVMPTLELAEALSKERLAPMFRDSPCFRDKIKDPRGRDSGNTLLSKTFPGGHLALAGANSPSSLSSRPRRVVIGDEYKSWPKSAGAEGDPKALAFRRTNTYWNKKRILVSTPLFKGEDIDKAYDDSDQRHFYVACPHCGEFQELVWKDDTGQIRVIWDKEEITGRHLPETASYLCAAVGCGNRIDLDAHKEALLAGGHWVKHNPISKIAGFHLNELYSPWRKLRETVEDYLLAKSDGIESFKSWWNTALGLAWDPQAQGDITAEGFLGQREAYPEVVPWGVGCLTAAIDVQKDRLEFKIKGWGRLGESWLIHREKIMGSPAFADVWAKADALLLSGWRHASGRVLFIEACAVDTGDGNVKEAYDWAKARIPRRVYPIKGQGAHAHPLIKKSGNKRLKLWHIGTEAAKDTISARLRLKDPGPGFMHFPDTSVRERYDTDWCNLEMFQELATSEHIVRDRKGRTRRWEKVKPDSRNEDLDLEVYAWAIYTLLNIKPADMEARLSKLEEPFQSTEPSLPNPSQIQPRAPRRRVLNKGHFPGE